MEAMLSAGPQMPVGRFMLCHLMLTQSRGQGLRGQGWGARGDELSTQAREENSPTCFMSGMHKNSKTT